MPITGRLRETASTGSRETNLGGEIISGPRSTRNKKKSYVLESSSSSEEEEEEGFDEPEQYTDAEGSEDDEVTTQANVSKLTPNGTSEEESPDAEGEDDEDEEEDEDAEGEIDAEGDIDMDEDIDDSLQVEQRPAPTILRVNGPAPPKPSLTVTPARDTKMKSVEEKEMEIDDDDDDQLSDIDSDSQAEDEIEIGMGEDDQDEDAEGEDVDNMDEDQEGRSFDDEEVGEGGSRASTPDVSKMTKRQRSRLEAVDTSGNFLQLPMEPQIKKHLTAEEHAMRRAEMARRRKNLSEKRNEEEKMDTINRLLKKQAPKRRGKISAAEIEAQDRGDSPMPTLPEPGDEEIEIEPANPVFVRWVNNAQGSRLGVPSEWLGTPVGNVFGAGRPAKMVQEVEG